MNIRFAAEKKTVITMIDTAADTIHEFRPDALSKNDIERMKRNASNNSRVHRGPANTWTYTTDAETGICTFDMEIEDEAIMMALPMAVKIAKVLSPLYDMGKSALKLCKNLRGQFDTIGNEFCQKFDKQFRKPKKYAVGSIWCEELEMFDVVILEDDGFGNIHVTDALHCGRVNPMSTVNRFALSVMRKGEETKDSADKRYPHFEFVERTRDEAVEIARSLRKGLQADADAFYGKNKAEENDQTVKAQGHDDASLIGENADPDKDLLAYNGDGSADSKYALVVCGIETGTACSDYRKYAVILDQRTNAPIEDIMTICDMPSGQPVDLGKVAEVVMAKSRTGEIHYEYDSISDIRDAILIMQNDKTYYSTKCADGRVNFLRVDMDVVYKNDELLGDKD